jgi:hypothetical protein
MPGCATTVQVLRNTSWSQLPLNLNRVLNSDTRPNSSLVREQLEGSDTRWRKKLCPWSGPWLVIFQACTNTGLKNAWSQHHSISNHVAPGCRYVITHGEPLYQTETVYPISVEARNTNRRPLLKAIGRRLSFRQVTSLVAINCGESNR